MPVYAREQVYLFRVHCSEENLSYYVWKRLSDSPSSCPQNEAHEDITVELLRCEYRDFLQTTPVRITEDSNETDTQRVFQIDGHDVTCPAGELTTYSFSYPMVVSIFSVVIPISSTNEGHLFNSYLNFGTIGVLTATPSVGEQVVEIGIATAAYCVRGANIYITHQNADHESLGKIVKIIVDSANSKAYLHTENTVQTTVSGTVYLSTKMYVAENLILRKSCGSLSIGVSKMGGSIVPANVPIVCEYTNSSAEATNLTFYVEHTF